MNSSAEVSQVLTEVQRLVEDGNFEEAAVVLSKLYNRNDELSHLERISVLDVYGNVLLAMDAGNEALAVFEQLISLSNLPEDARLRALSGMGRLNMDSGEYESAVQHYSDWLSASDVRDPEILLGLANSLYKLNQFTEAIPPMVEHIELLIDLNEEISRDKLGFLSVLAIETEDYENAAWVSEIMIDKFDNMRDWRNLAAIYYFQGNEEKRVQLIEDAKAAGHLDDSGNWIE